VLSRSDEERKGGKGGKEQKTCWLVISALSAFSFFIAPAPAEGEKRSSIGQ
jgi:hypothetical protein